MEDKFTFCCPHCGEKIFVAKTASAREVVQVSAVYPAPSPDEIPTTAIEVTEIPLKDVILEPEPIEEIEPDEFEPDPIDDLEELEELSPGDLAEYMPRRKPEPGRRSRPDAGGRSARQPRKGPREPVERRGGRPSRPSRGRAPAGEFAVELDPIDDRELEDIAIDLIMELTSVDEKAAIRIIESDRIIAVKNVTKEEAEEALDAFEAEGIMGTIKQKRPRR